MAEHCYSHFIDGQLRLKGRCTKQELTELDCLQSQYCYLQNHIELYQKAQTLELTV